MSSLSIGVESLYLIIRDNYVQKDTHLQMIKWYVCNNFCYRFVIRLHKNQKDGAKPSTSSCANTANANTVENSFIIGIRAKTDSTVTTEAEAENQNNTSSL